MLQFLVPGKEALETEALGAVSKRRSQGRPKALSSSLPPAPPHTGNNHKAKKHPFVSSGVQHLRRPLWLVLCARRMGCSQQNLGVLSSHPLWPALPIWVSKEGTHIHMEMLDLPPAPSRNPGQGYQHLLAQQHLPEPQGIS